MELMKCIEKRHSVRGYTDEPVPDSVVEEALKAAILAPSAGNLQARDFVVVRSAETKKKLAGAANQPFIGDAPAIIVCCVNYDRIARYGQRGHDLYCLQDVAASVENMLLYAASKGYGTCWIGAFDEDKVKAALGLPPNIRAVSMVPIGKAKKEGKQPPRLKLEEVVHRESW